MKTQLKPLDINKLQKTLFIFPHPDDETYASAGLIKLLTQNQKDCKVICLTKGEKSTLKFGLKSEDLSTTREKEFENVMNFLGVANYQMFNLKDGKVEKSPELQNIVKTQIETYKPNHVVTFEPDGIYGHPDHIAVSKIVTQLQTNYNYKILYATTSKNYKPSKDTLKMAKDPSKIAPLPANTVLQLSISQLLNKIKALRLYKSQVKITHNFFHNLKHLILLKNEYYVEIPTN